MMPNRTPTKFVNALVKALDEFGNTDSEIRADEIIAMIEPKLDGPRRYYKNETLAFIRALDDAN